MADGNVFKAAIKIDDQTHEVMRRIGENMKGIGKVANAVSEHAKGLGVVLKAAFGEAEHGAHRAAGEIAHGAHDAVRGMHQTAEAVHKATAELHRTTAEAREADHALDHAARPRGWETAAAHISLLRSRFGNLSIGAGEFGRGMSALLPVLGGLGVAGSLEGIFELTEKTAESFSQMSNAAQSIGVSVQQFQQLSLGAKMADVSVDTLRTGMFRLGYGMQDALSGRNKDLAGLFKHLHIDPHQAVMPVMMQLADAFQHTKSASMREKMAQALFGRGGAGMIPFLSGGADKLREFAALSDQVNFIPSKEQQEALERYHQSMVGLEAAVQGFRDAVGTSLADAMRPSVDLMRDWIASNRDWIAQAITEKFQAVGSALGRVDWKGIGAVMRTIADDAGWLGDHLGGAKGALEALIAVKAVSWGAEWIDKFLKLSLAIRAVIASVQALDVAISSSTIGAAIAKLIPAGARMAGGVGAGLYTFFDPTPTVGDAAERAQLDTALKNMGLPVPPHPDARALSNAAEALRVAREATPPAPQSLFGNIGGASPPPMPRLYGPGGGAAPASASGGAAAPASASGAAPVRGGVDVNIKIGDLPRGSTARVQTSGDVRSDVDVGYSMPGVGGLGYGY